MANRVGLYEDDRGPCIWAGRGFVHIFDPSPDEIHLDVIAIALSRIPRFNGHTVEHLPAFSVAQHSVLCAEIAIGRAYDLRIALMHDAAEAYIGDLIRPIKREIGRYADIEDRIWLAISDRFDLPRMMPAWVAEVDNIALATEKARFLPGSGEWQDMREPVDSPAARQPWRAGYARSRFLDMARSLGVS